LEQEIRVPAVALAAEDEEVGFWITQDIRRLGRHLQAVHGSVLEQRRRQTHWTERSIAFVDLQLPVEIRVRRVTNISDDPVYFPRPDLSGQARGDLEALVGTGKLNGFHDTV